MLKIDISKCSGCRRCEVHCSFYHTGKVGRTHSRIRVEKNENMPVSENKAEEAVKPAEEVKAEERIDDVIAHVREQAISLDLSPNLINDLYVRMIDEMVESEISEFKNAQRY